MRKRTIPAAEIRASLIRGLVNERLVNEHGERADAGEFSEAVITGELNLARTRLDVPLLVRDCLFEQPLNLNGARLPWLELTGGCEVPSVNAGHLVVDGDVCFDELTCGHVDLRGAHITHDLHIEDARLTGPLYALDVAGARIGGLLHANRLVATGLRLEGANAGGQIELEDACLNTGDGPPDRIALNADGLIAAGGIVAHRLNANGQVRFVDTQCTTTLELSGAQLRCDTADKRVLCLDRCHIGGSLYCDDGFTTIGVFQAIGAHIGGNLYLDGAHLNNSTPGADALILRRTTIDGNLVAAKNDDSPFTAKGRITMEDASIAGHADYSDAQLVVASGAAISAKRLHIGTDIRLDDLTANGTIALDGARIGCDLILDSPLLESGADRIALNLYSATLNGTLLIRTDGTGHRIRGDVDLCRANVGTVQLTGVPPYGTTDLTAANLSLLLDEPHQYSGDEHRLVLNGLTYRSIHMNDVPLSARLKWLKAGTGRVRTSDGGYQAAPHECAPQPYEELAAAYRRIGLTREARNILLEKHRVRTRGMNWRTAWYWRILNLTQDLFVGYGYVAWRAFFWVFTLLSAGTAYFRFVHPPNPTMKGASHFTFLDSLHYSMDLLIPGIDAGGRSAWDPADGFGRVLALTLMIAGWLLGFAIIAGVSRAMRRD